MLNQKVLLKNFSIKSKKFKKNLNKTKKEFKTLISDFNGLKIPLFQSYMHTNNFNFNNLTVKKFKKYKNIIIIGMGGSILGTKSIYSFFKNKIKKELFFFDNLDENLHIKLNNIKNYKNSCIVVVSKSGNTLETIANLNLISAKFLLKNKLVFITEYKDSFLNNFANKLNAEVIEHKDYIAGRYSVLSEVGMFPAALMGLNIKKFNNFMKLIKNKNFIKSLVTNVASIYTLQSSGIKNSVILNYDSQLYNLGYWYQQLVGESLGKKGKGINPILAFAPKDHHSLLQLYLDGPKDKFFTFFINQGKGKQRKVKNKNLTSDVKFIQNKSLISIIRAQSTATQNIFTEKNIPFRCFVFDKKKEEELGGVFLFFILETILLGRLMNVNPFDQPAVEQIKVETKKILSR